MNREKQMASQLTLLAEQKSQLEANLSQVCDVVQVITNLLLYTLKSLE